MLDINNQRPGVYSRYDTVSAYTAPRSGGYAAVVASAAGDEAGELYSITSLSQLAELLPAGGVLRDCVQILLQSGVSRVYAVGVGTQTAEDYEQALALVEEIDNVGAVICDAESAEALEALRGSVQRSAEALRERIAYGGVADCGAAIELAQALNCERVVLCCPAALLEGTEAGEAVYGAAALAGRLLAQGDPTWNASGAVLSPLAAVEKLAEREVQALLAAGVTVLEQTGDAVECVRALTTRTQSAGETDYALRSLHAILCIDEVMQSMRRRLRAVLRGSRLSGQSLQTIQSQVVVELAAQRDGGVIESYDNPKVTIHASDPTVCVVELTFAIAQVIDQIHITAHIQV